MHSIGPSWLDPQQMLETLGPWALWGALLVVFIECGLFIFLLPGDSLLFTVGLFIRTGTLHTPLWLACLMLSAAAFAGNVAGYEVGRASGERIIGPNSRLVRPKHVAQTHAFFERHGARALVLGRFVPVVRTFITLVAGVAEMDRRHFYRYSAIGAVLWASGVTALGYLIGDVPLVRDHVEGMLLVLVLISVLPVGVEWLRHRRAVRTAAHDVAEELTRPDDQPLRP